MWMMVRVGPECVVGVPGVCERRLLPASYLPPITRAISGLTGDTRAGRYAVTNNPRSAGSTFDSPGNGRPPNSSGTRAGRYAVTNNPRDTEAGSRSYEGAEKCPLAGCKVRSTKARQLGGMRREGG